MTTLRQLLAFVVSVYLLVVFGGKMDRIQASLDRLADSIREALRTGGSAVTP